MTFGPPARCDSARVVLPEDLRMPDLSHVREVTWDNLEQWSEFAYEAITWGAEERNGCYRQEEPESANRCWYDLAQDSSHSPDEWTPTADDGDIRWFVHGRLHRDADQPAVLTSMSMGWWQNDQWHRAHAPATIAVNANYGWYWRGQWAGRALNDILTAAWADTSVDDRAGQDLLDQAAEHGSPGLAVAPATWVAHVLAANPSPNLSPDLRRWFALLTT